MREKKLKVALVCDWLTEVGGAEQVLLTLHQMYPEAPIYTSQYREGRIDWFSRADVRTGWLNLFPVKLRRLIAPLRQRYFKKLDLRGYDLVISVTGSDAKFVKTDGVHICYCHCPTQYYFGKYEQYLENPGFSALNPIVRRVFKRLAPKLRERDFQAAKNPTKIITISKHTKQEIKTFYKREAKAISPPVNTELFSQFVHNKNIKSKKSQIERDLKNVENLSAAVEVLAKYPDGFYLNFSRQVSWKNLDLIVKTCKKLELPLVLVGDGPENSRLRKLAGGSPFITFLKPMRQTDLAFLSSLAKAFIFPSEEPFGLAPVEAMSAGCPVIALKRGGAMDYLKEKTNGFFFERPTVGSLKRALLKFEEQEASLSRTKISKSVARFSRENFEKKIKKEIDAAGVIPRGKRPEIEKPIVIDNESIRRGLFITFPAVLFFSNWPRISLGETESMYLKLTLPLIWLGLFALLNFGRAVKFFKKHFKTPLVLLVVPLLSLIWTSDLLRGVLTAGVGVCIVVSIIGSLDLLKKGQILNRCKRSFLFTAAVVCVFCILQIILDAVGVGRDATLLCPNCVSEVFGFARPNGFSIEPQFMGSLLLAPYLLSLNSLLENKNRKSQVNYFIVTLLTLVVTFLTLSRGAIFALLFASLVILIKNRKSISKVLKILGLGFVSLIFSLNFQGILAEMGPTDRNYVTGINSALSQLTFNQLGRTEPERVDLEVEEPTVEIETNNQPIFNGYIAESTDRRLELSSYALKISTENPTNLLFGTGIGSAGTEMLEHFPEQGHKKEIVQNQYLETLLEVGLVGVISIVLAIITLVKLLKLKFEPVTLALVLGFSVQILFFSGFSSALHIYLLPLTFYILSKK